MSGDNGAVTYELVSGVNKTRPEFGMFPDGSLYVAQKLDREVKDRYELMVKAKDGGSPLQRTATTMVHVNVLDDNDNAPEFTSNSYEYQVVEGKEAGTFIGLYTEDDILLLISMFTHGIKQYANSKNNKETFYSIS